MIKFAPIGSIIKYDNTTLRVISTPLPMCTGCFFSDAERKKKGLAKFSCYMHKYACTAHVRKDKSHVIFMKVEV